MNYTDGHAHTHTSWDRNIITDPELPSHIKRPNKSPWQHLVSLSIRESIFLWAEISLKLSPERKPDSTFLLQHSWPFDRHSDELWLLSLVLYQLVGTGLKWALEEFADTVYSAIIYQYFRKKIQIQVWQWVIAKKVTETNKWKLSDMPLVIYGYWLLEQYRCTGCIQVVAGSKCNANKLQGISLMHNRSSHVQTIPQRADVTAGSFQPSSSTPDVTHLINWSQSSESWLVKLCALDWLEQKPGVKQPFVE